MTRLVASALPAPVIDHRDPSSVHVKPGGRPDWGDGPPVCWSADTEFWKTEWTPLNPPNPTGLPPNAFLRSLVTHLREGYDIKIVQELLGLTIAQVPDESTLTSLTGGGRRVLKPAVRFEERRLQQGQDEADQPVGLKQGGKF